MHSFVLALSLASAHASPTGLAAYEDLEGWYVDASRPEPVVGGDPVRAGDWDDAVGVVFYGAYVGCTGTLVAPKVVVTAGHCVDGGISHVLVGSKNWAGSDGELIEVDEVYEYPNSQSTYDAAVLTLVSKSSFEPRPIATDCILDRYLTEGADVAVVGFGNTRADGGGSNSLLNEGVTLVQDADCNENQIDGIWTGCNPSVSPGGEIAAGGNQVDACYGDSGGPLYLLTPEGDYLVGITSRAYAGVSWQYPCRDGGIYVRPDALVDWFEEATGRKLRYPSCNEAPDVEVEELVLLPGTSGSTFVQVDDPDGKSENAQIEVIVGPEHGTVELLEGGEVVYHAPPDFIGSERITLAVTDVGARGYDKERSGAPVTVEVDVPVVVTTADAVADDLTQTETVRACGCSVGGGVAGVPLLLVLPWVRRRRDR